MPDAFLDALAEAEEVRPIDLALARALAERDSSDAVALAAVLASAVPREGHTAFLLGDWAGRRPFGAGTRAPNAVAWREALRRSPVVATPDDVGGGSLRPLVWVAGDAPEADRVALARHWRAERRLGERIAARLGDVAVDVEIVRPAFEALFPDPDGDRQALAAVGALRNRFAVVAGGPGTGKTTTVVKLLALLLTAEPDLDIRLAAPTGKAADRLGGSVATRAASLPVSEAVRERIPTEAVTLHRLLGYSPSRRRFLRDAASPLAADVVVLDEASMADLSLFDALVGALRPEARLILLGDPDQLPSVGAGAVLGDLAATPTRDAIGPGLHALAESLGLGGFERAPEVDPVADAVVRLTVSHRFSADSGIGALARAVNDGDEVAARAALSGAFPDVALFDADPEAVWAFVRPQAEALCGDGLDREATLAAVDATRVLAPTRGGTRGVHALNAFVERRLVDVGLRPSLYSRFYHGRPILVAANDYDLGLFNGDLGVVWARDGRPVVLFEDRERGGVREVSPALLPDHETAWAMTVHKSQGSEFDRVLLVLPEANTAQAERLTRELVYTAITRAKGGGEGVALGVAGDPGQLLVASRERVSGLRAALSASATQADE